MSKRKDRLYDYSKRFFRDANQLRIDKIKNVVVFERLHDMNTEGAMISFTIMLFCFHPRFYFDIFFNIALDFSDFSIH